MKTTMPAPFAPFGKNPSPAKAKIEKTEVLKSEPARQEPATAEAASADYKVRVQDALCFLVAKSIPQLADECDLPRTRVKKIIEEFVERDDVESRDGYYRYCNAAEWVVAK